MEFPHLMRLIAENQFDTIYHEHFSYFSFFTVERASGRARLEVFDVEELSTHGGSLRVFACHATDAKPPGFSASRGTPRGGGGRGHRSEHVPDVRRATSGATKRKLLQFLITAKGDGKRIVAYGAAGKGNTLLNYCGIGTDFIDFVVDRNPHKQGMYTPGAHIPIRHPDALREARPDFVLILAWNHQREIRRQVGYIQEWGGGFVVPIPSVQVVSSR